MTYGITTVLNNSECAESLAWIDKQRESMIQTVIDWSHINSGSNNMDGLTQMQREIVTAFARLEAEIELIDLPDTEIVDGAGEIVKRKNAAMIRISKRPKANKRILLTGHYDTVFASDSAFQKTIWQDEQTLNGPGVADMKGGILVMLHALEALEQTQFRHNVGWEVLLSPDEETGSLASAPILVERAASAHMGMTYEPALADGTLAGARKGSGNYTVVVRGKSAHAGRDFHDGRNAVVALSKLIEKLSALTGGCEGLTLNVATLDGGVAPNVVPDFAMCRFNVRLEKLEHEAWLSTQLDAIIGEASSQDGIEVMLHGGINRPPKEISKANQCMMDLLVQCGDMLDIHVSYKATGGCCEGNNLAAAGLPNIDTLGVRGGLIHSDREFALVDSFTERAKLSTLVMMAFAEGHFDEVIDGNKGTGLCL